MPDDNRIPTNQSQLDINASIQALNTQIAALNNLIADLGLVSITPISQQDYDALSQAEKLAGVFDIYDAVEPDIDGNKVLYDSNTSVVEKIDSIDLKRIDKTYTGIAIASANQYVKISDYSDLPFTQSNLISAVFKGYSPNCIYQLQCYSDGIYLYSNTTVTNGNVHLFFIYKEE